MAKTTRQIASCFLSLCLAAALLAGQGLALQASAGTVALGTTSGLTQAPDLTGTEVYYGYYNDNPIKWHVVAKGADDVTLWTTTNVGGNLGMPYDSSGVHNAWSTSEICEWLNKNASGGFLHDAFKPGEIEAMVAEYGAQNETYAAGTIDSRQKIVLPSVDEIGANNTTGIWDIVRDVRAFEPRWWLRTPGALDFYATYIDSEGYSKSTGNVTTAYNILPAFKLNLSSVFFTSAAEGGKSSVAVANTLTPVQTSPTGALKLTIKDPYDATLNPTGQKTPALTFAETTNNTSTLRFGYSGASFGTNQYLSCVLEGGSGITHYGKLATCATAGSGTLSLSTGGLAPGSYTLKVFSEQANEDKTTDYTSDCATYTLAVDASGNGSVTALSASTDAHRPTVSSTTPSGAGVAVNSSALSITFNEAMNTTVASGAPVGTVSLAPAGVTLTFASWSNNGFTANYTCAGFVPDGFYTYNISGFQDAAGNEMAPETGHTFTTSVSTASLSSFTISCADAVPCTGTINAGQVSVTVPFGTNLANLTAAYTLVGAGATANPDPAGNLDWSQPYSFDVVAQDGTRYPYTVTVIEGADMSAPTVSNITAPVVDEGQLLNLTAPAVASPGSAVTGLGWQTSADGTTNWTGLNPAAPITAAHNGQFLRYFATNSGGTSYSNIVQITVNTALIPEQEPKPGTAPEPTQAPGSPQTGDAGNTGLFATLGALALGGLAATLCRTRKRRKA